MPIDASRDHLVVPAEVRVGPSPAAFMILAFWQKSLAVRLDPGYKQDWRVAVPGCGLVIGRVDVVSPSLVPSFLNGSDLAGDSP